MTILDPANNGVSIDGEVGNFTDLERTTNKDAANGYSSLDATAKVPTANLPDSVLGESTYKGVWDAATNTPTLAGGAGNNGDTYKVNVEGSQDLGDGTTNFKVGNSVIYNATTMVWDRIGADLSDYKMSFTFDSDVTASAPASGTFKFDNATASSVTTILLSEDTNTISGVSREAALNLKKGSVLTFASEASDKFCTFSLDDPATPETGHVSFTVSYINDTGAFVNSEKVSLYEIQNSSEIVTDLTSTDPDTVLSGAVGPSIASLIRDATTFLSWEFDSNPTLFNLPSGEFQFNGALTNLTNVTKIRFHRDSQTVNEFGKEYLSNLAIGSFIFVAQSTVATNNPFGIFRVLGNPDSGSAVLVDFDVETVAFRSGMTQGINAQVTTQQTPLFEGMSDVNIDLTAQPNEVLVVDPTGEEVIAIDLITFLNSLGIGHSSFTWNFSDQTSGTAPASSFYVNNASPNLATLIRFDNTGASGNVTMDALFENLSAGAILFLSHQGALTAGTIAYNVVSVDSQPNFTDVVVTLSETNLGSAMSDTNEFTVRWLQAPPVELVTDLVTDDDTKGLASSQGVVIESSLNQLRQTLSTGFEGTPPVISINGGDNTKFDMTAGVAEIVDNSVVPPSVTRVVVPAVTAGTPTFIGSETASFISIGLAGTPVQRPSRSTPEQRRDEATVGLVSHVDNLVIDSVVNTPQLNIDAVCQTQDVIRALGFFSVRGNQVSGIAGTLTLQKATGAGFALSENAATNPKDPHNFPMPDLSPMTLFQILRDASVVSISSTLDPTTYDNAGVETVVPANNNATISYVYAFPNNSIVLLKGQEVFATFSDAKDAAGTESFIVPQDLDEGGLLLARVVIKKNATDVTDSSESFILPSSAVSGGGASLTSLQQGYEISVEPEFEINSTQGALSLKDGRNDSSLDVIEVKDFSDVQTFAVTGAGDLACSNATASGVDPNFRILETDGSVDEKLWDTTANNDELKHRTRTDADGLGSNYHTITRTGTTVDTQEFREGRVLVDDTTDATTTTDGSLQTDGGLSVVKSILTGSLFKSLIATGRAAIFGDSSLADKWIQIRDGAAGGSFGIDSSENTVGIQAGNSKGFSVKVNSDTSTFGLDTPDFEIDTSGDATFASDVLVNSRRTNVNSEFTRRMTANQTVNGTTFLDFNTGSSNNTDVTRISDDVYQLNTIGRYDLAIKIDVRKANILFGADVRVDAVLELDSGSGFTELEDSFVEGLCFNAAGGELTMYGRARVDVTVANTWDIRVKVTGGNGNTTSEANTSLYIDYIGER